MRSSLILLALGGTLVGTSAHAGVIEYTDIDGARAAAWTSQPCEALEASKDLKAECVDSLDGVSKTAIGPGGGILIARAGAYSFEVNPKTGHVSRVLADTRGTVKERVFVVGLKLPPGRRLQTLVSGRIEKTVSAEALVSTSVEAYGARLVLSYVVGRSSSDYDTFELSFDVETLEARTEPPPRNLSWYTAPPTYWN
ncbi:MAG: hypothetical protein EA397_17330 [Deltaproteobacteria bacterium]|nr:MAG: hypothetical protein EA397_17330 [Deltaproteobacteria bacterium]